MTTVVNPASSTNGVENHCNSKPVLEKLSKRDKERLRRENETKLKTFLESITVKSDNFLAKVIPAKIVALTKLSESFGTFQTSVMSIDKSITLPPNPMDGESSEASQPSAKKRKLNAPVSSSSVAECADDIRRWARKAERTPSGVERMKVHVPMNLGVVSVLDPIKKEAYDMIEMVSVMKLWIQLNIPRIEDGNNFGVGVQEEIVGELCGTEDLAFIIVEHMTKYFISRAKLVSKVVKWPCIADFRQAVIELDEREYAQLSLDIRDLRNQYLTLFDIIHKNMEKLKQPRGLANALHSMF
eukprot:175787_1